MSKKVGAMSFEKVSRMLVREYGDEVVSILQDVVPAAADIGVRMIRDKSRKRTGLYAKDWAKKNVRTWRLGSTWIIYNRKKYRVAHLLEKDHDFKNGSGKKTGDWKGDRVIEKAEEYTAAWLESEVVKRLT